MSDPLTRAADPAEPQPTTFATYEDLLRPERDATPLAALYRTHIQAAICEYERDSGRRLGAAILEPLLLGAGGMQAPDPLFQRTLVGTARERGIPIIADEVFSGLWRLGRVSAFAALGLHPDIACFAKLLTGGTIPLSATVASERVFEAFLGDSKADALLHGHSYSGHPIGLSVAAEALRIFQDPASNPVLCSPGEHGRCQKVPSCKKACGLLVPQWDATHVEALSHHPRVLQVVALGTVVAVHLRPRDGKGGYGSGEAVAVTQALREAGIYARPLGNVVYLMITPTTTPETAAPLLKTLLHCVDRC